MVGYRRCHQRRKALDLRGVRSRGDEQTPPDVIAKLKLGQAELATHLDQRALQLASAQEAVAYYLEAGDRLRLVRAQTLLAGAHFCFGHTDEAFAMLDEALSIARRLGFAGTCGASCVTSGCFS